MHRLPFPVLPVHLALSDYDQEVYQILKHARHFWSAVGHSQKAAADAQGLSAEARAEEHASVRLDHELQRYCRSLIVRIDRALEKPEIREHAEIVAWLQQYQRQLLLMLPPPARCYLLELPAEIRELIFVHAVTDWMPATTSTNTAKSETPSAFASELIKQPIRIDRFNQHSPASVTLVSQQVRAETLHLYYQENIWEFWRPLYWLEDWSQSTFIDCLACLGPERTAWLRHIILLYKNEDELEHDIESALAEQGFVLNKCTIDNKQELSEYELYAEQLGLPRRFGRKH